MKEDLEEISQSKEYEGEGGEDLEFKPAVVDSGFDFAVDDPFIHRSPVQSDAGSKPAARIKTIVCACVIWNIQRSCTCMYEHERKAVPGYLRSSSRSTSTYAKP